jgi:hypothetical protein
VVDPGSGPQPAVAERARALDALRGLSILFIVFSGGIPFGVLPGWMYQAQIPPTDHIFAPGLPGITWLSLVFPFFLFTMGAAIPLALSCCLERGDAWWKIVLSLLARGLLLAACAVYIMHIRPWLIQPEPDVRTWGVCLLVFLLLFPIFARLPAAWKRAQTWAVKVAGWTAAVLVMTQLRLAEGTGFSLQRSDISILVLSNVAVAGGVIWLLTRNSLTLRLGVMGILLALRLASQEQGWVQWLWSSSPVPWLFQVRFLQYLFITIPGTIVGDAILSWMTLRNDDRLQTSATPLQLTALALFMILLDVLVVVGLKERWVVITMVAAGALCVVAWRLLRSPTPPLERFMYGIFQWGTFWLLIGFFYEPYEGGIKQDHTTVSYYFVTTGLAIMTLITLTMVVDAFKHQLASAASLCTKWRIILKT